jgi:hypothetical protein
MADKITLTFPPRQNFHTITHLLLGGLAARLELTLEDLADLEIAFDAILDGTEDDGDAVTVRMAVLDGALETTVGPLSARVLERLGRDHEGELGLRRVLDSTVDDVVVDGDSVRLTKKVALVG